MEALCHRRCGMMKVLDFQRPLVQNMGLNFAVFTGNDEICIYAPTQIIMTSKF
jgi:hypothetical protein